MSGNVTIAHSLFWGYTTCIYVYDHHDHKHQLQYDGDLFIGSISSFTAPLFPTVSMFISLPNMIRMLIILLLFPTTHSEEILSLSLSFPPKKLTTDIEFEQSALNSFAPDGCLLGNEDDHHEKEILVLIFLPSSSFLILSFFPSLKSHQGCFRTHGGMRDVADDDAASCCNFLDRRDVYTMIRSKDQRDHHQDRKRTEAHRTMMMSLMCEKEGERKFFHIKLLLVVV